MAWANRVLVYIRKIEKRMVAAIILANPSVSAGGHTAQASESEGVKNCNAADAADRGAAFRGCHAGIRAGIPAQPKRQRGGSLTLHPHKLARG